MISGVFWNIIKLSIWSTSKLRFCLQNLDYFQVIICLILITISLHYYQSFGWKLIPDHADRLLESGKLVEETDFAGIFTTFPHPDTSTGGQVLDQIIGTFLLMLIVCSLIDGNNSAPPKGIDVEKFNTLSVKSFLDINLPLRACDVGVLTGKLLTGIILLSWTAHWIIMSLLVNSLLLLFTCSIMRGWHS